MKYEYFVSFSFQHKDGSFGNGNQAILTSNKLTSIKHIRRIENKIFNANPDWTSVVVINFILF